MPDQEKETVNLAGSNIKLSAAFLAALCSALLVSAGIWFSLVGSVDTHGKALDKLEDVPAKVQNLERDGIRRQGSIDRLEAQANDVQRLLIRIDERTQQTSKDIVEIKAQLK
jgi:hypothetical protein